MIALHPRAALRYGDATTLLSHWISERYNMRSVSAFQQILAVATLLGGLEALLAFADRIASRHRSDQALSPEIAKSSRDGMLRSWLTPTVPAAVVLCAQWSLAVFLLAIHSTRMAQLCLRMPLWLLPLAFVSAWLVGPRPGVARMVGGISGAFVNAAIEYSTDQWVNPYAAVTGAFFGALAAAYFTTSEKQSSRLSVLISTSLLVAGLGVFSRGYIDGLLRPSGFAFVGAATAAVASILIAVAMRLFQLRSRPKRKRAATKRAASGDDRGVV